MANLFSSMIKFHDELLKLIIVGCHTFVSLIQVVQFCKEFILISFGKVICPHKIA